MNKNDKFLNYKENKLREEHSFIELYLEDEQIMSPARG